MRKRANDKVVSNKSTGNLQIYFISQRYNHQPTIKELDIEWHTAVSNVYCFCSRYLLI